MGPRFTSRTAERSTRRAPGKFGKIVARARTSNCTETRSMRTRATSRGSTRPSVAVTRKSKVNLTIGNRRCALPIRTLRRCFSTPRPTCGARARSFDGASGRGSERPRMRPRNSRSPRETSGEEMTEAIYFRCTNNVFAPCGAAVEKGRWYRVHPSATAKILNIFNVYPDSELVQESELTDGQIAIAVIGKAVASGESFSMGEEEPWANSNARKSRHSSRPRSTLAFRRSRTSARPRR